jgi:hypothetical protein
LDANEILPASSVFTYQRGEMAGHLSGFADWFRYELLHQRGGWWVDTDMICLAPFEEGDGDHVFASVWEPDTPRYVNNNVIFARAPGSAVMAACAERCRERGSDIEHAETGPVLLHETVRRFGLERQVTPPSLYNPIQYRDVELFYRSPLMLRLIGASRRLRGLRPIQLDASSKGLHLYSALLRKTGDAVQLMKDNPGSFLARVVREHAPESLNA